MRVVITHLTGALRGERQVLDEPHLTIGRAHGNVVRLGRDDTIASGRHAVLVLEHEGWVLHDLGATNGTYVNGRRIGRARLEGGETIAFGFGGPEVFVELLDELPEERPSPDEPSEFPFRAGFARSVFASSALMAIAALVSFVVDLPIVGIPASLAGALLFLLGLAAVRINITVGPDGIEQEGMFRTHRIEWTAITALEVHPPRGLLRPSPRHVVRGGDVAISFSPSDYQEGQVLARLVAETSRMEWGPPAQ